MENLDPVDQRRRAVGQFIASHQEELVRKGAIVPTWRRRNSRTAGPYFLLVLRDSSGRQHSAYLGSDEEFVNQIRAKLGALQASERRRRQISRVRRQMRREFSRAKQDLDIELSKVGLNRKGHEIRGWARPS